MDAQRKPCFFDTAPAEVWVKKSAHLNFLFEHENSKLGAARSRADGTDRVGVETLCNPIGTVLLFERVFQRFFHRSGHSDRRRSPAESEM